MVHVGHDSTQVREMGTFHKIAYCNSRWGQVIAECGVFHTTTQGGAAKAGGAYANLLEAVAACAVLAFERGGGGWVGGG